MKVDTQVWIASEVEKVRRLQVETTWQAAVDADPGLRGLQLVTDVDHTMAVAGQVERQVAL